HHHAIGLTLSEGWVLRYLQIVQQLRERYLNDISEYGHSWIELIELKKQIQFDRGPRPTKLFKK
ncbi:MAG: hypothetical protein ACXACR_04495, partial [Candidatus Hodarchaeales archaeon]